MPRRYFGSDISRIDEPTQLDMKKEPKENMKLVLTEITSRSGMSASKKMGYVNNFTKLIQGTSSNSNLGFSLEEIIICLRIAACSKFKEVRAAAVRAFRYLFTEEQTFSKMMKLRVDMLIVRCLDKPQSFEVERVQALRFVRKVVAVCPRIFPMSFAHCLVAIAADNSQEKDRLARACIATMCELAVTNVQIASYCGGVSAIISCILDSKAQRMNECLMMTLLYLINNPMTRSYVRSDVGLEGILAPFTDLHYNHCIEIPDAQLREDRESRLETSKMAIATIFKTWPGLISLCRPDGNGLESLLQMFCLPDPPIKKHIMDILIDVFRIPVPEWTDDFVVALKSIDPRQMQDSWKLSEGFVAEEAQSLLPHRANVRVDLLKNYTAIVLTAFVNAGLFESLVQVITTSEDFVSVRATIVLGELLHLANTLLPPECSSHTHCLPTLMNIATSFQVTREERGRASSAVNCLDRLHQLKKRALGPYSLFLEFLTMQSKSNGNKNKQKKRDREKESVLKSTYKDVDYDAIRDMLASFPNFSPQQWDGIADLLESPAITLRKLEENGCSGFIHNLLQFYKPSSQQFCTVELKHPMAKKLSEIGILLIEFLLVNFHENQRLLEEFVEEFSECLEQAYTDVTKGVFSDENLVRTTSRNYFVFLGKLSFSSDGHKLLGTTGVYQHYLDLASMKSRDSLLKLILASLDYSRADISRIILGKILTASTLSVRLYATKFLLALLRAKVAFFNNWGIEMLVTQLYDPDRRVAMEAADVLDEACEDEANLQYLVQLRPALLQLGDKGWRLLTRFLSVDKGFTYLNGLGHLDSLMEQWCEKYCNEYVKWVEESLAEALTTYQKPSDEDGGYVRQSSFKIVKRHVYVPTHFFGEIVKLKSGYEHLKETGYALHFTHTIRVFDSSSEEEIHRVKTALWALGHIGTSSWGLSILEEDEIIPDIVHMATECNVLTIRGTCFYVLGLIATTRQGADILKYLNWDSVRHKGEDSWPVVEVKDETLPYSRLFVSSLSAATDYYRQSVDESVRSRRSESESEEVVNKKSVYDDDSGVYLGTEYRQSNVYDKSSGVYLGEEAPQVPKHDEGTGTGILLRLLEEKQQEIMLNEDNERDSTLTEETSNFDDDENAGKAETPSLLERIKQAQIPAHLMPPPNEPVSESSSHVRKKSSHRRDSSPRARSESHPRSSSVLSNSDVKLPTIGSDNSGKTINLTSFENVLGDDSLISRILNTACVVQLKIKPEIQPEPEDSIEDPRNSAPKSCVQTDADELRHVRSSSGISDTSNRSMSSSIDTSQSLESYKSQTSLNNSTADFDLERMPAKSFKERLVDLNRTRSSSLNEKVSTIDLRLNIKGNTRSASFSGTADEIDQYRPIRGNRQLFRSEFSISSPSSSSERRRMTGSNTEVMLLDNKTLVLKNLKPEDDSFSPSYFDQMSMSDMSSVLSRNNDIVPGSMDERRLPRKCYSRSASSASPGFVSRDRSGKKMKKSVTSASIWSLLSVPMSPASPCHDLSNFDLMQVYPSFRDAHGYSALSNLRKNRSFNHRDIESRIGGFNQSFTIVGPPIPESRPLSLDLPDSQTHGGSMILPTPSPMEHSYSRKLNASTRGNEFLGLTLPMHLDDFFVIEESEFKGSWAENFNGVSTGLTVVNDNNQENKVTSHDHNQCLSCMDLSIITGKMLLRNTSEENVKDVPKELSRKISTDSMTSGNALERILKGKRGDALSAYEISLVKKEVLRIVVNLSSAVTSKTHQQSLRCWKENLPQLFEDLCLYSQVIEQMNLYHYKLSIRRFIQGFFETVKFTQLVDQAEAVIKKHAI